MNKRGDQSELVQVSAPLKTFLYSETSLWDCTLVEKIIVEPIYGVVNRTDPLIALF